MNLYAPEYYKDFACIKGECRHSCCLCWEIDVDSKSIEKYSNSSLPYTKEIRESIDYSNETPHFRLDKDGRCPHLDERGLCKIITNLSEDYLCDICREHPRFYNRLCDRWEVGLGISCEAAARIILSSDSYDKIIQVGKINGEISESDFDVLNLRNKIFTLLSDRSETYLDRLKAISELVGVSFSYKDRGEWEELFCSLEYLDKSHRDMFLDCVSVTEENEEISCISERFLAYLIYRHLTPSESFGQARESLGLCLFLERVFNSLRIKFNAKDFESAVEFARIISEEIEYSTENIDEIKLAFFF